eukprot:TRINITY_DN32091_c0_g1_i1.p1 TRINITY_DN32091_c0_g1~~TRINITY_DN32091_c0_g1_i1.p1  ORF type:complete len:159 (+),score=28.15 TRINITY_DN32091_c0_g1_i1:3-479(+)
MGCRKKKKKVRLEGREWYSLKPLEEGLLVEKCVEREEEVEEEEEEEMQSDFNDQCSIPTSYANSYMPPSTTTSTSTTRLRQTLEREALSLAHHRALVHHEEQQLTRCAIQLQALLDQSRPPSPPLILPPSELPVSSYHSKEQEPIHGLDPTGRLVPLE